MGGRPQPSGKNQRTIDNAEKYAECARLRAKGMSYPDIAAQVGYKDKSSARRAVQHALVATVQEAGDELRALELERYNRLEEKCWQVIERVHYAHSAGRLITMEDTDGGTPTPLVDDAPTLMAMDRLLKIMDQRAKLVGLNAPTRHEVLTISEIDLELARLDEQLANVAARGETPQAARAQGKAGATPAS